MAFIDEIGDPLIRQVFRYWLSLWTPDRLPSRGDIDPVHMPPPCLPNLYMYRMEKDGRLRYLLVGTAIVKVLGHDFTGKYVDDVLSGPVGARRLRLYRRVIETGRPLYYTGPAFTPGPDRRRVARLVLPLSSDGEVCDHLFGIATYGPPLHDIDDEQWLTEDADPATIVLATDDDLSCGNGAEEEVGQ